MAITVVAIFPIQNILLQLLVGFLIMIPLSFISYQIIANYYKNKGSKDDEHKKNTIYRSLGYSKAKTRVITLAKVIIIIIPILILLLVNLLSSFI